MRNELKSAACAVVSRFVIELVALKARDETLRTVHFKLVDSGVHVSCECAWE